MKKFIICLLSICMIITSLPYAVYAIDSTPEISLEEFTEELSNMQEEYEDEPVSNRLIVKSKYDINELDSVDIVEGYDDLHIIQFDNSESAEKALTYYEKNTRIEYAEKDISVSTMEISYPYGNHLSWGSDSIGVNDYFSYLDSIDNLPEIVVGVIDTGIDIDHEFLKDRVIETGFNISDSGVAYSEDDDNGHGTHVAGIIADNTRDNVKIKGFKCLNSEGSGIYSNVILSIYAAIDSGVDVINMSLGAKGKSHSMEEAVNTAVENGITVCVSAGNDGLDAKRLTPANIDACITVAAIDEFDNSPYWSCSGECVDIVAPGVSINSSVIGNQYGIKSGTSMAAPFVSAAASLLLTYNTGYSSADIDEIIKENGRSWAAFDQKNADKKALYIGSINSFIQKERASKPVFNYSTGRYSDSIYLDISSEEENSRIFYTLDGTPATEYNGIPYIEPILIDCPTLVHASVYVEGKYRSLQQVAQYYITTLDNESKFEISDDGIITKYSGTNTTLTIPDEVNGITVRGIGKRVFQGSDIYIIKLPQTCVFIDDGAFDQCDKLVAVYADNIQVIGEYAFDSCNLLTDIDITNVEYAGKHAFDFCISLSSIYNEKLTEINEYAFSSLDGVINATFTNVKIIKSEGLADLGDMTIVSLDLPEVKALESCALTSCQIKELKLPKLNAMNINEVGGGEHFGYCPCLETVILPTFEGVIPKEAFIGCTSLNLLFIPKATAIDKNALSFINDITVFAPRITSVKSSEQCKNIKIYCTDALMEISNNSTTNISFVAPSGSYTSKWAAENGCDYINSYSMTNALGGSIRLYDSGLRFGFSWDNIAEFESIADSIEYGFLYEYGETTELNRKIVANNRIDHDGYTTFNLVFTNIPKADYDTQISARAYVCIDGMYFYSDIKTRSFECVANAVLADETMDEATKEQVRNILEV